MSKNKVKILKEILAELIPYWEQAEWFLLLLNEIWNNEWSNELFEKLYQEILQSIRSINSKTQQEHIKNALMNLKQKSELTIEKDQEEAEQMLDDFFIDNI